MSYQARFTFVGTPVIPKQKENSKRPFCKEIDQTKDGKKKKMLSMTFGVKESDSNMAFVEAFGSVQDVIKTMDSDNEKIDIDWDDRFDEDVVDNVASYRKYTVDLGEEYGGRQEFISSYDMIRHLKEYLPDYDGRIVVTGQFTRDWYKNQYYNKYKIQNVFAAPEKRKSRLLLTADLFYNKNSLDDSDYDETKKMTMDCYLEQYIDKDEGRKYIPIQVVFSGAKYDMDNEKHKKLFDNKMSYMRVNSKTEAKSGDDIVKVKGSNYVHMLWEIVVLRGAEEVDFDESMLTERQREQIELGIRSIDDFKPKGSIFGNKVEEFRLKDVLLNTGTEFEDGYCILVDDTVDEFEENIYQPAVDETVDEAKEKSKAKTDSKSKSKTKTKPNDEDDEDEAPFDEDDEDEEDLF